MAEIKNEKQLVTELRRFLRHIRPDLDTSPNSIFSNLILIPAAIAGRVIFDELGRVQDLQVLSNVTEGDLDREAENYGLERKKGRRSRGFVVFYARSAPTTDVVIPSGTLVSTPTFNINQVISYRTMATVTLPGGAGASSFFVRDKQRYETLPVPVEAVAPGLNGTIGPNRITLIQGVVSGIDGVYNPDAITGGQDRETDDVFRARIRRRFLGREKNIRKGVESILLDTYDFEDARVIRPLDDESERVEGVDVYVIDSSQSERTQLVTHRNAKDVYQLDSSPMLEVLAVAGQEHGLLEEGTHYWVERDTETTSLRLSTRAFDVVRISPTGHSLLSDGEQVAINYTYANEIARAQQDLDLPPQNVLTSDILIKKAIRYGVSIKAGVTFFGGVDEDVERAKIELSLSTFFDRFNIGDPLQLSDLIVAIESGIADLRIQSVDQVIIRDVRATNEFGDEKVLSFDPLDQSTNQSITFGSREYARLDSVEFSTIS